MDVLVVQVHRALAAEAQVPQEREQQEQRHLWRKQPHYKTIWRVASQLRSPSLARAASARIHWLRGGGGGGRLYQRLALRADPLDRSDLLLGEPLEPRVALHSTRTPALLQLTPSHPRKLRHP